MHDGKEKRDINVYWSESMVGKLHVKVVDVWDKYSHIYYEIFHDGIQYILSKHDLNVYLNKHDLIADIHIQHRYPA